jgi:hypothetical protein
VHTGRNYFALISNFVEESINSNRKDQGFLLVEIRIAIQGVDSIGFHKLFADVASNHNLSDMCLPNC